MASPSGNVVRALKAAKPPPVHHPPRRHVPSSPSSPVHTPSPPTAAAVSAASRALVRMRSSVDLASRGSVIHPFLDGFPSAAPSAIDPQSRFLKVWHQVLLAKMLYDLFLIPFVVTFEPRIELGDNAKVVAFYIAELLFVADFWVKWNTTSVEDSGRHHANWRARFKSLLTLDFVLDVVAVLPLSLLPVPKPSAQSSKMYWEMHKVVRLKRIPPYLLNLDDIYATQFEALKIFKTIVTTMLLSHYIACVRLWFGYDDLRNNHWLPKRQTYDTSNQTEYLQALFWSFGMLTGLFEGELPRSVAQFVFTIVVALCGFSVFTYLCGMFFMLSKCESGQSEEAEARINQLKHVMTFHQVPDQLQARTVDYLQNYSTDAASNDRSAMKLLCPSLAKDLQDELLNDTVARIPVFAGCSTEFVRALTNALDAMFLPAHCTVFRVGDEGDAMYIIHSGVLDVVVGDTKVRELRKGDFVGELSLFSNRNRSATVVTTTYSILYRLSRFHTEKVLEGYPRFTRVIRETVDELIAKADQRDTSKDEPTPPHGHEEPEFEEDRRGSAFTSQLIRMMTSESKKGVKLVVNKSAVSPEGSASVVPLASLASKEDKTRTAESSSPRRRTLVGRLRRVLTLKQKRSSNGVQIFHDHYARQQVQVMETRSGWGRLLLKTCVDADSHTRLWWIFGLQLALVYDWILTLLQLAFPAVDLQFWYINLLSITVDLFLFVDIYLNFNLSFNVNSEKISDPLRSAVRYLKQHFAVDLLLAFPYWLFGLATTNYGILRIPRLLRAWRLRAHLHEIDRLFHMNSKRKLILFGVLLLMLCHVVACLYFSITHFEGFSPERVNAWIPTHDVQLTSAGNGRFMTSSHQILFSASAEVQTIAAMQYFRAFYYATNVLTGLGKTVEPASDIQYILSLLFMYSGFIITAVVVDNVQKRFTASAFEQKEFFAVQVRIQFFLRRQNAPLAIHHRVNSYLDYWWSVHRGAHVEDLLTELPLAYRREVLRSICSPALQTLALLAGVRPVLSSLETEFVDKIRFVLYGQGEFVYHDGDSAHCMYFLLHGSMKLVKADLTQSKVPLGGFFGLRALEGENATCSYVEDAVACSGCILIRLTRHDVDCLVGVFDKFVSALVQLEQRLLDNKLARFESETLMAHGGNEAKSRWRNMLFEPLDPDSRGAVAWETWLFLAMTVQWVTTLYHMSFAVHEATVAFVDALTIFLEVSFLIDVWVRCRMGYHEFGNKIMELRRIRRRYLWSKGFLIDAAALVPMFAINWMMPSRRYELFNINKLFRLLKVPGQFKRLEQRYLKRTTELRVFKLGYYTFLLTHLSGCVYHDFASHLSTANTLDPHLEHRKKEFGWNDWLLVKSLEDSANTLRYFSSLFWSFGLMSASYQGELPKTMPQCVFSVMTMMGGFFLFAYVIGNFSDVIEMADADNREFNARLGSVRHLLAHFMLPEELATKLKGFFFFKRYHTITQENHIEASLPPSLVTDIRLLNLQPMIAKVPFMGGMDPAITRMLVAQFSQVLVLKDDYVYRFGDEGSDMFFVFTGLLAAMSQRTMKRLEVVTARSRRHTRKASPFRKSSTASALEQSQGLKQASLLVSGDFFGENALFSDSPRNAFVLAKTSCILYSLSRQSLNAVFELYPTWKKQVIQSVKVQQKRQRLNGAAMLKTSTGSSRHSGREDGGEDDIDDLKMDSFPPLAQQASAQAAQARWKRVLLALLVFLKRGTEAQSRTHIAWLRLMVFCTVFNAVLAPYRISIDALDRWTGICIVVRLLDIVTDVMAVLDIWFNWHLRESALSIELYEQKLLDSYKKERLVWDVIAATPIDYVLNALDVDATIWFRLLRCVKVVNLNSYLNEIDRRNVSYEWARFGTIWLLCSIYVFWCACAYLALAVFGGFGSEWNAWMPSHELEYDDPANPNSHKVLLRFLRGMLHATTAFVKKARTFYPETTSHLAFSICMSFMGVLVMAFMIGEIASLYISLIRNQVEFRKNHISLELFLSRYKVSRGLRDRVHVFLSTLWSSHSGVNYENVLAELPPNMRTETIVHIADRPLNAFVEAVFRPLMRTDTAGVNLLLRALATELKFEGYPRGECVISEGVISNAMYFVVRGHLQMTSASQDLMLTLFRTGQFFGEKGIISLSVSRVSVRTLKPCDLFSLSGDALVRLLKSHSFLNLALRAADEVVGRLRAQSVDGTNVPKSIMEWKTMLRSVLKTQREEWMSATPSAMGPTATNGPPNVSSRGATQWSALLVDILDGELKDGAGLPCFERLFQLLAPNGVIYEKPVAQRTGGSRLLSNVSIGSAARKSRFRDLISKASTKSDDKSLKSIVSAKVMSMRDTTTHDEVRAFAAEI